MDERGGEGMMLLLGNAEAGSRVLLGLTVRKWV